MNLARSRSALPLWLVLLLALALSGCGGGGSGVFDINGTGTGGTTGSTGSTPGTTGGTPSATAAIIDLSLRDPVSGATKTTVSADSPGILTATVRDSSGAPVVGAVVTFSSTIGTFNPSSGTALTDASGNASISLNAGNTIGADNVTASVSVAGSTVTSTFGFTVSPPNLSLSPLSVAPATLSAGGTASVSTAVLDSAGRPFTTPVSVVFSSLCAAGGRASFGGSPTASVTTVNGVASASYLDRNCASTDTVTATLSLGGATLTRNASLTVLPASAGSIQFVSATPTAISLRGTGGVQASTVVFRVIDTNGQPVGNASVNFSLNTTAGSGITFAPASATSAPDGTVQTIVNSGTVATPVRVTAQLASNPAIASVSEQLTVSTGIPHQEGFSIAASILNIEGLNVDGATTTITARLSDRFGNLVRDGTAVSFRTEGGQSQITPSCITANGACTVTLSSSGQRPANGRLNVLATAIGEESFTDANGNGIFDPGESFRDLPEAFVDGRLPNPPYPTGLLPARTPSDENGIFNGEEFVDFNSNGRFDAADGCFNGLLRAYPGGDTCATSPSTLNVRSPLVIVLSGSDAVIGFAPGAVNLAPCTITAPFSPPAATVRVTVTDVNDNPMPAGTTVAFATTNGTILSTPTTFTVANTNTLFPASYSVTVGSDATQSGTPGSFTCTNTRSSGSLTVTVTTPRGVQTINSITVTD